MKSKKWYIKSVEFRYRGQRLFSNNKRPSKSKARKYPYGHNGK